MMLLSGLLVAAAALYPLSHIGFRDALQALLKSFDIAVEQYARVSGTHWYDLELTATDNLTLERIHCRCPVVGTWKNGFIVLHDGPAPRGGQERGPAQPAAGRGPADPGRAAAGGGGTGGDAGPHLALAGQPHRPEPAVLPAGRGGDRPMARGRR